MIPIAFTMCNCSSISKTVRWIPNKVNELANTPCALRQRAKAKSYIDEYSQVNTPEFLKDLQDCNAPLPTAEELEMKRRAEQRRKDMLPSYVVSNGKRYRLQTPYLEPDHFQTWKPKRLLTYNQTEKQVIPQPTNQPHNHRIEDPIEIE